VKNRTDFVVSCGEHLIGVLKRRLNYRHRRGGDFVFHRQGRMIVDFRTKWEHVRELLEKPNAVFHDCRRSFATNGEDAGLTQKEIMETGCWRDARMVNYYSQVKQRRQKSALDRLARYVKGEHDPHRERTSLESS
jgi:integrase